METTAGESEEKKDVNFEARLLDEENLYPRVKPLCPWDDIELIRSGENLLHSMMGILETTCYST